MWHNSWTSNQVSTEMSSLFGWQLTSHWPSKEVGLDSLNQEFLNHVISSGSSYRWFTKWWKVVLLYGVQVDVRDHEKLCGEQIECKCGLTFAFKCNMVAHKKAHPACQDPKQPNQISTSVSINATSNNSGNPGNNPGHSNDSGNNSGYQSTVSDEDSTVSRWISPRTLPSLRLPGTKRCHELVEESRPDLMSKHIKVYSRRTAPAQNLLGLGQEDAATSFPTPAQNFRGLGQEEGATKFSAGGYDFTGLGFAADGISLWSSSNVHYPSIPSLPFPILGSVPGPVKSIWEPHQIEHAHRGSGPGRLSALDLLHLAGVVPGLWPKSSLCDSSLPLPAAVVDAVPWFLRW